MTSLDVNAHLSLLGKDIPFEASVAVVHLDESHAMVVSDGMTCFSTK